MMTTEHLVRIETTLEINSNSDAKINIKAHESVKGENPFKCDNIKLNGEPIEGREFSFSIFDTISDSDTGLSYKLLITGDITDSADFVFPQILTFENDCQIGETLAIATNMTEMSLKPSESYTNKLIYNFGKHIFFKLLDEYTDQSKYELRSVKERYPFDFIPIVTDRERLFTDTGYTEIETYHDGKIMEFGDKGMKLISNPSYIISVEHQYSKFFIDDDKYTYEPEPIKFREFTVDTSKSMYEVAKILEELTKDMINW